MSGSSGARGAPSPAVQQAAEDACVTMQAAVAALKESKDASCPAPSRQQVQAAVQALRMEAAKMGLLYNQESGSTGGKGPTDREATALLAGFQRAVCTMCMLFTGLAAGGGGPTLRASLHQTATSVVEACVALVRGAVLGGARGPQLMLLSGFLIEMLEAAGRAPLDNRTAIGRAITQVLKQLSDALKELDEAIQEAAETADTAHSAGAADGQEAAHPTAGGAAAEGSEEVDDADVGSDVGFGFEQEAFDAHQLAVARRAHALLAAAIGLVRAVVKALLAERDGSLGLSVEAWESMLYHIRTLAPLCDNMSAAVYPPQDSEELASSAEALATSCDLLAEECPTGAEHAAVVAEEASNAGDSSSSGDGGGAGGTDAQQQVPAAAAAAAAAVDATVSALRAALASVQAAHGELAAELQAAGPGEAGTQAS